jgi:predicted ribosomally synthesized peptide with SipW-like signal peptide
MKKIFLSSLVVIAVAALGVGATFALFSDTETSTGNTFAAGTIDLKVDGNDDPDVVHVTLSNMKPGDSVNYQWTLSNAGSLAGQPWIEIVNLVDNDNNCNEPESVVDGSCGNPGPGDGELSQNLLLQINAAGNTGMEHPNTPACFGTPDGIDHTCPLDFWASYGQVGQSEVWEVIGPGLSTAPMVFGFSLPSSVGNIIQSDSVEFDIVIHLDQI